MPRCLNLPVIHTYIFSDVDLIHNDSLNDYFEDAVYFRIFRISDGHTIQINHFLDYTDFDYIL